MIANDIVAPNTYKIRTEGYQMPKQKRYKTKYAGVYYINGRGLEEGTKEKVYGAMHLAPPATIYCGLS